MEIIIFIVAMVLFVLFVVVQGMWDYHKAKKKFINKLYNEYGTPPQKEYKLERFIRIASYHKHHPMPNQLDDITWNDLNMDEIFKRMNYAYSAAGEEYLYHTLRSPQKSEKELKHLEEIIQYFMKEADDRVNVQFLMRELGHVDNYSLFDYLEYLDTLGERTNTKHIITNCLFFVLLAFTFINTPIGLFGAACILIYNMTVYFKEKKEIEPYITSFIYIVRVLELSDKLVKMKINVCEEEWNTLRKHKKVFNQMVKGSFWVLSSTNMNSGGNPLDILVDYLRMAFHIDLIKFNKMLSTLFKHIDDIDILISTVGYVETAICIGEYRTSLQGEWSVPHFIENNELSISQVFHPLIGNPIKNSIKTQRGVLLTGSNASGKSTFLKTIAINAVFAQTIHTTLSESYTAPFYSIYSSMSLKDSLESGESYYIVEIKSIKRILQAQAQQDSNLLCFVDEVLRGTNTIERISASTQILKSLATNNTICFAATHDIELTGLLNKEYDNYHFEEEIRDGDVYFNYKLLNGKATTRNAILLLEIMGYHSDIINMATKQAETFIETGVWK